MRYMSLVPWGSAALLLIVLERCLIGEKTESPVKAVGVTLPLMHDYAIPGQLYREQGLVVDGGAPFGLGSPGPTFKVALESYAPAEDGLSLKDPQWPALHANRFGAIGGLDLGSRLSPSPPLYGDILPSETGSPAHYDAYAVWVPSRGLNPFAAHAVLKALEDVGSGRAVRQQGCERVCF